MSDYTTAAEKNDNQMGDNRTLAQFLEIEDFPFIIRDEKGNIIYTEWENGDWEKIVRGIHGHILKRQVNSRLANERRLAIINAPLHTSPT